MKIWRHDEPAGAIHHANGRADGDEFRIAGYVLGDISVTAKPVRPVLFAGENNTTQHPAGSIEPLTLSRGPEVDYGYEPAVATGQFCKNVSRNRWET